MTPVTGRENRHFIQHILSLRNHVCEINTLRPWSRRSPQGTRNGVVCECVGDYFTKFPTLLYHTSHRVKLKEKKKKNSFWTERQLRLTV